MADVDVTTQEISRGGITPSYAAGSASNTYHLPNDGRTYLHFKKTGAGACNVTIQTPGTVDSQAVADRVVQVPATTGDKKIGPFPRDVYNDGSGELVFTLSEATGLTFGAFRF